MENYKYRIKIYDANSNNILVNFYEGSTFADAENYLANLILNDVYFTFNFEKNTNTSANTCNLIIQGLGHDIKDKIKEVGKKYYSTNKSVLKTITWQGPVNKGEKGKYEYSTTIPTLVGVKTTSGDIELKTKNITNYYKEFGYSKIEIYDQDYNVIYRGDIISVSDDEDNLYIECGTAHYFLSLPYSQRILNTTDVTSFITNKYLSEYFINTPSKTTLKYSPENYFKVLLQIIKDIVDVDIFKETKLFGTINYSSFFTNGIFDNDYFFELLSKIIKANKIDLSVFQATAIDGTTKKLQTDAQGKKIYINGYYYLKGTIEEVIRKLTEVCLIVCFVDDDVFKFYPYFETSNYEADGLEFQYQPVDNVYTYKPIGGFVLEETDLVDTDVRVSFITDVTALQELFLTNGCEIYNGKSEDWYKIYIDTISVTGDSNSATVNYSGRTTNFDWRT